jgi:phosphoribosylformylglycinamidine synthase
VLRGCWAPTAHDEPATAPAANGRELARDLLAILSHPNVRSKEDVVRRYDHEVQGGTVVKPFTGVLDDGPSDAAVLKPLEVADSWRGIALGCAFNPAYGAVDPYAMAVSAIDEAVRNVVAVGADPERIAILDNFCWGNPLLADRMGGLVRAGKGCYDGAVQYGVPFISGKDSLNNEYADGVTGQQEAIPPSLLISAIGIVPDVRETCTMDLKAAGNALYVLGVTRPELGGSYYYRMHNLVGNTAPGMAEAGPATARALHGAIRRGLVRACHDCSEGGLAVTLAEMTLAGGLGADVVLGEIPTAGEEGGRADWLLFSESNGRYVVEVEPERAAEFEALLGDVPHARVGRVTQDAALAVRDEAGDLLYSLPVSEIRRAWRGHLDEADNEREGAA